MRRFFKRGEPSNRELLQQILANTERLLKEQVREAMDLTQIQSKVTAQTTVVQSAVTLLGELSALIKANVNNPTALQAIADGIDANSISLANAVTANTPAAQ
jgi:hypothetical protein